VALLEAAEATLPRVGDAIAACRFRDGLREALTLARAANRYLDGQAPWKEDDDACATTLYTALAGIETLKVALLPYLPFSAARLHALLGHVDGVDSQAWTTRRPTVGAALPVPAPLFRKIG
jgi:methionyl-tRNA synthetase